MWRVSSRRLVFDRLARTRIGAEALTLTQREMRAVGQKSSWLVRLLARRRSIDQLAVYVDGPLRASLHPSFAHVTRALTALLCAPVLLLLVTGVLQPTYYMLVPTGLVTAQQYVQLWQFAHWAIVLAGQLAMFVVLYDLSVYVRYPCFAYVVAPLYRACGLVRTDVTATTMTRARAATIRSPAAVTSAAQAARAAPLLHKARRSSNNSSMTTPPPPQPRPLGRPLPAHDAASANTSRAPSRWRRTR